MAKLDVVVAQKAAVLAGQEAVLEAGLGACYDQGLADAVPGGLTQADLDAAVAAIQVQFDELKAKYEADLGIIAALQGKLDAIKALL